MPSSNGRTKAILVTGGRGFIGRRLVQHLVESQGRAVISADVLPAGRIDEHTRRIDIEVDIRDRDRLREVFTQFDISTVFDLASVTAVKLPRSEYVPNLEMTKSIVECVLEFDVEKYVFYSTQLVFRKEGALPASDQDYLSYRCLRGIENSIGAADSKHLAGGSVAYSPADVHLG